MDRTLYVLISHEQPLTFVIGVFNSEEEALSYLGGLIKKQKNFPKLSAMFEKMGINLDQMGNTHLGNFLLYSPEELADTDEIMDLDENLNITIIDVSVGEMFYFPDWTNWHNDNLYQALGATLRGEPTIPEWSYATKRLILRYLD